MIQINFFKIESQVQKLIFPTQEDEIKSILRLQRLKKKEMQASFLTLLTACLMHQTLPVSLKLFHTLFNALAKDQKWTEKEDGRFGIVHLPSYPVFVKWYNRLGPWLEKIVQEKLKDRRIASINKGSCLMMVDSTLLNINSGKGYTKSLNHQASLGYSSCGTGYGFKLHMLADALGHPLAVELSTAKMHDLEGLKLMHQQPVQPFGIVLADRGYISKAYYFELMQKNTILAARPKDNMENANNEFWFEYSIKTWPQKYKKLYKNRQKIEHEFAYLKHRLHLNIQGARALGHVLTKVFSALLVRLLQIE